MCFLFLFFSFLILNNPVSDLQALFHFDSKLIVASPEKLSNPYAAGVGGGGMYAAGPDEWEDLLA